MSPFVQNLPVKNILLFVVLLPLCLLALACDKNGESDPVPSVISIKGFEAPEGGQIAGQTTTFTLKITLDKASSKDISVDFKTADQTAVASVDYAAKNGTLTIPANATSATIDLNIFGDDIREADETFLVSLSNPVNATLSFPTGVITILNDDTLLPVANDGYATPQDYPGYDRSWADEFSGSAIDLTSWGYDIGGGGWGNNELEYYTDRADNSYLNNGYLVLEAKKENFNGRNYTSARMLSKGKRSFTFGRIDIRAKLPFGQGVWPALWMLGENIGQVNWPACGEIDIMEVLGHETTKLYGTAHWGPLGATASTYKTGSYTLTQSSFSEKFHVFSVIWTADQIEWYVDDVFYHRVTRAEITGGNNPFDKPFFFILNVAVGGNWPGVPDNTTTFPQRMIVDYVRVFKKQ